MSAIALFLVLSAAPQLNVFSVSQGPSEPVSKGLSRDGATLVDGSRIHEYLLGVPMQPGPLFQDYQGFEAPPIAGWPASIASTWTAGLEQCRALVGPQPWKGSALNNAKSCSERLGTFLWNAYLVGMGATRAYELSVEFDRRAHTATVRGSRWEVGAKDQRLSGDVGPEAETAAVLERVARVLQDDEGKGSRGTRPVVTSVEGEPATLFPRAPVLDTALPHFTACAQLPATLSIASEHPFAQTLQARWAASTARQGPALSCTLSLNQ